MYVAACTVRWVVGGIIVVVSSGSKQLYVVAVVNTVVCIVSQIICGSSNIVRMVKRIFWKLFVVTSTKSAFDLGHTVCVCVYVWCSRNKARIWQEKYKEHEEEDVYRQQRQ